MLLRTTTAGTRLAFKSQTAAFAHALRYYSHLPLKVKVDLPNGISYEQPTGLFINNQFVPSKQGKTFEVLSPSTEEEITHVYEGREEDVDAAVEAADKASFQVRCLV